MTTYWVYVAGAYIGRVEALDEASARSAALGKYGVNEHGLPTPPHGSPGIRPADQFEVVAHEPL